VTSDIDIAAWVSGKNSGGGGLDRYCGAVTLHYTLTVLPL